MDRVWSSKECACCARDPSVHLSVPFIVLFMFCKSQLKGCVQEPGKRHFC